MADQIVSDSSGIPHNVEEFHALHSGLACRACRNVGMLVLETNPNNGGIEPVCPCGERRPIPGVQYLAHRAKAKAKRQSYKDGDSLDEVWERFGNRCVTCSATKEQLIFLGIGRQRQHVAPYATHGHTGQLVPMCVPCHNVATVRQREFQSWLSRLQVVYAPQSVSAGSPGVSTAGVPSDSLPAEGQDPDGQVAGISGDHAHP